MKQVLKVEFNRAIQGWGMRLTLLIGVAISVVHVIQYQIPANQANLTGFYKDFPILSPWTAMETWLAGNQNNLESFIYFLILPLMAALPFGTSYFDDTKSGFLKSIYMRTSRREYLSAKYLAAFLSGGIAVAVPLILNLMCSLILLPNLFPVKAMGQTGISDMHMFYRLFFSNPLLYTLIFILIDFLIGGIWACVGLAASFISDYKIVVLICPFFIQLIIHVVCTILDVIDYSSVYWTQSGFGIVHWWIPLVYFVIGTVITAIIFRKKGEGEDVF